ncbi:tripartite tricarboxylate transporter substrate binding protein [Aestuariispira ectoiniformans]|uniref:tripartite tricarboxylate transporter substrate binding protein n=1 Tax=Aestuariispira ectoiniformans TaxID=2775080 RepID=UPI00223B8537|nr:tripartite tricarboxylate transporter substrate binding protein [Aestuariispira ectoiniformans]
MRTLMIICALITALPAIAHATGSFPDRPVTIFVGFRAGGGSDAAARILAADLEKTLGQTVIVQNVPGAGGGVAAARIKSLPADGYTIGFAVATTFSFDPMLGQVSFDIDDFTQIAATHGSRSVFVSPPNAEFKDFKGMIALAKKRGWLNYASILPLDRMLMEYIGKKEGLAINIVPTKGGAGARQAVLGGYVDLAYSGSNAIPMHEEGALKVMATSFPDGIKELPEVPSLIDLGYGVYSENYSVFFGPANMDPEVRKVWTEALRKASSTPKYVDFVRNSFRGSEVFLDGDQLDAAIRKQRTDFTALKKAVEEK